MKRLLFGLMTICSFTFAQSDSTAQASEWKHSLVSGLLLTQMSYTDWAQGGENALAYTITIDGKSIRDVELTNWSNTYKIAYGQTRLGSKGLRKTDDKLELESVLTYKFGTYVNPYASATFKSQFADGFKYDDVAGTKAKTSAGFDPMYLTQAVGVGYQPVAQVKTRLGAAIREVFSGAQGYADDAGTTPTIETSKVEGGLESVTDAEWKFEENLLFTTKLEMFAPFNNIDVVIVRSNNTIVAKVNEYISVNLNVQLINDANITARTQVKQSLAMGLTYTLL
ncbi:MAG: DUF3078 domain-containing protein [Bacteroidota bacterium]|nr:DUF3078 domain-containing protein [Bacteroidota bacterium]